MKKKHIVIGGIILLAFVAVLFLQKGGENMRNTIAASMIKGLKGVFVSHNNIPFARFSEALSPTSQCKPQKNNEGYVLHIAKGFVCTATIDRETDTVTRTLPELSYQSGVCHIKLEHTNNPQVEKPEKYDFPDTDQEEIKLNIFENGARLTIKAGGNNDCRIIIAQDT